MFMDDCLDGLSSHQEKVDHTKLITEQLVNLRIRIKLEKISSSFSEFFFIGLFIDSTRATEADWGHF